MTNLSFKIFKPRDKDVSCEHWIDCNKKAEWCTEHQSSEGSYFQFFCKEHLDRLIESEKELK